MPSAIGTFKRLSENRVEAQFQIDGIDTTFTADVNPAMPPFSSKKDLLKYNSPDDLSETHSYNGTIGPRHYKLSLDNGVTLEGDLDQVIGKGATVDGRGNWVHD
ncbi:hypothetical protein CNMCM7691_000777 [Aspergillus felis]|uniref:Uncharacterized protein n=1 Tax=Aspergillus felis TaxID=1287682 RepID=A0A8H6V7A2_9EURO|nr:hypothetical protein CNMCM7691_000777 [Aspergillus felis]